MSLWPRTGPHVCEETARLGKNHWNIGTKPRQEELMFLPGEWKDVLYREDQKETASTVESDEARLKAVQDPPQNSLDVSLKSPTLTPK